jgi:hydroxyacylglutathione hydrolase
MLLKRLESEKLAQVSYLIGSAATGEALVVDPARDVDVYLRAAEQEGVEITHVAETHIHADFVSGARELAERTGARLYLSDEGGPDWKYAYAGQYGAVLLNDGDTFQVGDVEVRALHTPGHTPEHLSFLVTDRAAADEPMGVFTGDFLFVGDVGRPDLLEKAAQVVDTMEASARALFQSLERFREGIPDFVQIWPGHGAGSVCGKVIGAVPQSTLGYEKRFNWALTVDDEDEFVEAVLAGQPEPPAYFAEMKRMNRTGPLLLGGTRIPSRLSGRRLAPLLEDGVLVIDTRQPADFGAAHVPGTINIPLNRSFPTWAGWLVPYDRDFYLVVDDECSGGLSAAVHDLAAIGLDRAAGYWGTEVIEGWKAEKRSPETTPTVDAGSLAGQLREGAALVLDVRSQSEWDAGHLPTEGPGGEAQVRHIPLGELTDRLSEVPTDRPVAVHCHGGGRSAIAASLVQANGYENVVNFAGGFSEWAARGYPIEEDERAGEARPAKIP